jgi:hypothetical protein
VRCCSSIRLIKHTHQLWRSLWIHFKTQASFWCDGLLHGFTGNPQEGQVWDMQLALGSTN